MNNDITQKFLSGINMLSSKLSETSVHVLNISIRREIISSSIYIVCSILLIIFIICSIKYCYVKNIEEHEFNENFSYKHSRNELWSFTSSMVTIVGIGMVFCLFMLLIYSIVVLTNPEYYAIKDLLNVINGN